MNRTGEVFSHRDATYRQRGNGVRSLPLAGPDTGSDCILSGITELPPGGQIPLHHHNTDEFILVLAGTAVVTIADRKVEVGPMDSTLVYEGVPHRYFNSGTDVLRILWVYGDVHTTRTIEATGITLGHLDRYDSTEAQGEANSDG